MAQPRNLLREQSAPQQAASQPRNLLREAAQTPPAQQAPQIPQGTSAQEQMARITLEEGPGALGVEPGMTAIQTQEFRAQGAQDRATSERDRRAQIRNETLRGFDPANIVTSIGRDIVGGAFNREPQAPSSRAVQLLGQGASFGFGDEIGAGAAALQQGARNIAGVGGDTTAGEAFDQSLEANRQQLRETRQAAPVTSFVGEGIGGAFTALPGAAGFINRARTRAGATARATGVGAATGAVVGGAEAEGGLANRAVGALTGAAAGTALGIVAPLAIEGAARTARGLGRVASRALNRQRGGQEMTSAQRRAWRRLTGVAEQSGITEGQLAERFARAQELGSEDLFVFELLGNEGIVQARGGVASNNPAAIAGLERVRARQATTQARVQDDLRIALGGDGSDYISTSRALDEARQAASPLYNDFRAMPGVRRANDLVMGADGEPVRMFHGTGNAFDDFDGPVWAAESPDLANEYAAFQASHIGGSGNGNVRPLFIREGARFNGDRLSGGGTLGEFITEALDQAAANGVDVPRLSEKVRPLLDAVREGAEGGGTRTFQPFQFWNDTRGTFGRRGAKALDELFELLEFDGITFTEAGGQTTGVLSPSSAVSQFGPEMRIEQFFQDPTFVDAARQAARSAQSRTGRAIDIDAGELSPDVLDRIKRSLDERVMTARRQGDATAVGDLSALRDRYRNFLDETYPGIYSAARRAYAGAAAQADALELGESIIRSTEARAFPENLAAQVRNMSADELASFRIGVARGVNRQMQAAPNIDVQTAGGVVTRGGEPANIVGRFWNRGDQQEVLRAAFGNEEAFARFAQRMARETEGAESLRLINVQRTGSPTQANQQAADIASGVVDAVAGNPLSAGLQAIRRFATRPGAFDDPRVNEELQRILFSSPADVRPQLEAAIRQARARATGGQASARFAREASTPAISSILAGGQ